MTGAEVFATLCKEEELAALFCCPGNYTVINAIAAAGVPSYGGRCEGSMCAAADGFSRATGEVTACSGTEGPGLTNMIMNIASAAAGAPRYWCWPATCKWPATIAKPSYKRVTSNR